jgi:hypothetical protein
VTRHTVPNRAAAIAAAARFEPGATVLVYAEELAKYGEGRNPFTYEARVVRRDTLPGSDQLTGRIMVETTTVVHYQKTATRGGSRTYQTAKGKPQVFAVWPWDIAD